MAHSIDITQIDHGTPLLRQATKDEIEEGKKVDTNKSANQIFEEKVKGMDNSSVKSITIFKVNVGLRESNPDAYTPKIISIGPYHNKNPQLGSMKKYKLLYLQRFLKRKTEIDVESCISKLEKNKDEALKCYDVNIDSDIVVEFSQMMLLDGCFIVEFIRECCGWKPTEEDEIINREWMMLQVCRDMLLLENQLPYFVLTMLHEMTKYPKEPNLIKMVKSTFPDLFPNKNPEIIDGTAPQQPDHLLDVLHMLSRPSKMKNTSKTTNGSTRKECCNISFLGKILQIIRSKEMPDEISGWECCQIPSATELYEAGVSFQKLGALGKDSMDRTTIFDIKFKDGLFEIPCFAVEDTLETFLRNMIAYEQHSSSLHLRYYTDYGWIMSQLIVSHKDVNLLRQNGIMLNEIGHDKQVATIFNKLTQGVITSSNDFYCNEECIKIIQHYENPWNQMMAKLRHNYFQSPWAGASTVAAIVLLLLTVTQTVLSLISALNDIVVEFSQMMLLDGCFIVEFIRELCGMKPTEENRIINREWMMYQSSLNLKYYTDYAWIMTQLIVSHKDVNFLRQNGIILNEIGHDKQVATIFNKLTQGVITSSNDFYCNEECIKIIQHYENPWNQMMAKLRHNYFQSPWAGASTVAAIVLLLLTVTQTVLSLISAFK
ncbi:UPF0481 protein At3g47200-like [Nicotiana tomentosiformis]